MMTKIRRSLALRFGAVDGFTKPDYKPSIRDASAHRPFHSRTFHSHWQLARPTGKLPHSLGIASGERLPRPGMRNGWSGLI